MSNWNVTYKKNDLMHHGVQGQKWGIRRYQNPDGTLTRMGRLRYGYSFKRDEKAIQKSLAGKDKRNKLHFGKGFIIKNHYQTGLEKRMDKALRRNDMESYEKMGKIQYKGKSSKELREMGENRYARLKDEDRVKKRVLAIIAATAAIGLVSNVAPAVIAYATQGKRIVDAFEKTQADYRKEYDAQSSIMNKKISDFRKEYDEISKQIEANSIKINEIDPKPINIR